MYNTMSYKEALEVVKYWEENPFPGRYITQQTLTAFEIVKKGHADMKINYSYNQMYQPKKVKNELERKTTLSRSDRRRNMLRNSLPLSNPLELFPDHTIREMVMYICAQYDITIDMLLYKCRYDFIVEPRQILAYYIWTFGLGTLKSIGNNLHQDHSTVINSITTIKECIKKKKELGLKTESMRSDIQKIIDLQQMPVFNNFSL